MESNSAKASALKIEDYIEQRLDDQMNWFDRKSQLYQKQYKRLKLIQIGLASLIPLMAGYMSEFEFLKYFIGAFGVIITLVEAVSTMNNYQTNWLEYRVMAESLKRERFLFLTKCSPYNDNDADTKLVLKIEALLAEENSQWVETMRQQQQQLEEKEENNTEKKEQ